jgi:hypothetical protein
MIITPELAGYCAAVVHAVTIEGRTDIPLTDTCPECGTQVTNYMQAVTDDGHLVIQPAGDTYAVIVGCEGFWTINPKLLASN